MTAARCDLHVHSRYSTDSGNYALRRARLGESFNEPERVYRLCRKRGMTLVTISDHNTVDGALRIAHHPGTFLSVEVTTRFPEDDVPLHVLVWDLTEEDHADLQPFRPSVYELVGFLRERGLAHALAHPLYRMGPPITARHVERMMLLFEVWEGRNGGRPGEANELACRLAPRAVGPAYLAKLAERHDIRPRHQRISLTGGSDDHSSLDVATTWTEAEGGTPAFFVEEVRAGRCEMGGVHGSTVKLAHALAALGLNAYRESSGELPASVGAAIEPLFDEDADDAEAQHRAIELAAERLARMLDGRARTGGSGFDALRGLGDRVGSLLLAGALQAPYFGTAQHHASTRAGLRQIEATFFGPSPEPRDPRALVFTDTYDEMNGVAGTMRRLAAAGGAGVLPITVVAQREAAGREDGLAALEPVWSLPLPAYTKLDLRFPLPVEVLRLVEDEKPDVIQVATPGPLGMCALGTARLLGLPLVGSYHTELGPYALHLTHDLLVAEAMGLYVDWFYRQCDLVLAPTRAVADALAERGFGDRVRVWSRGVDADQFDPERRDDALRERLLDGGDTLLLSVGRVSQEKRLDVLVDAFARRVPTMPGLRLAIVGDGPWREELEASSPPGITFLGELRGDDLAAVYASADVFCFPSTTDTFGQVLMEAAASGLPSVAAAAGGALDLVSPGETGLLVPPADPVAFAAAVRELAASSDVRRWLGARARAAALERTWARSWDELRVAYAELVETAPARQAQRICV